jgi:hypothetical protein
VARSSRLHPDSTVFTSSWLYNYVYTPYTHPDGVVVPGGGLLTGTATTENFNPTTIACGNQPGPGALDAPKYLVFVEKKFVAHALAFSFFSRRDGGQRCHLPKPGLKMFVIP